MNNTLKNPLRGIIPPMVTPLNGQDTLDSKGLERLIEHLISGGVHGLFILGSTGEAPGLGYKLRYELIEKTCNQVNGRIPLLVGITDSSASECLRIGHHAAKCGADAVVCAPPYYYKSGQGELRDYYNWLAGRSALPLFLYNIPSLTKTPIEPETVQALLEHENIIGLKDSSANPAYFQKIVNLVNEKPDFSLLVGPEQTLVQSVLMGGHGGVNGGANMFPRLYVDLYEAVYNRDYERITSLQKQVFHICSTIYTVGESEMSHLKGIKAVLSLTGICNDYMAKPFHKLGKKKREKIRGVLQEMNIKDLQS